MIGSGDSPLERALERVAIPYLWQLFNLPGKPGASCRSPFREDRHPSFSVYADGKRWHDHATGADGDAADFVSEALKLSREDGCRKLIEIAGTGSIKAAKNDHCPEPQDHARRANDRVDPLKDEKKAAKRAGWPTFEIPTRAEIASIAGLRDLSREGVAIAAERGLLFCAWWKGHRAWIVTDGARLNAQARRMDGKLWEAEPWETEKEERKAQSLPGSIGRWPVGIKEAQPFAAIALVEGGPDLLAALHLAWIETSAPETLALGKGVDVLGNVGVVAMFGATNKIADVALPLFARKRVRLFVHDDHAGQSGIRTWATALKTTGATVDGFGFHGWHQSNGEPVNDLNDFVRLDVDEWESERSLIESAFDFVSATPKT